LQVHDHEDKVKKADKSSPQDSSQEISAIVNGKELRVCVRLASATHSNTEIPSSPKEPPQEDATRLSRPAKVRSTLRLLKLTDAQKEAGLAHFRMDKIWINKVASTKPSQLQYSDDLLIEPKTSSTGRTSSLN
jgi:hypothetical protein